MALTYTSNNSFYNILGNASDGQIHFQLSITGTATPNGPFEIYVSAWGPDDEVLHESAETGVGEMTLAIGDTGTYDVPIPLNDDGSYKAGTYRVRMVTYDTDSASAVDTKEGTVEYTPNLLPNSTEVDELAFTAEYDCITGLISATDETPLTGWNESVVGDWRTISVVPPPTPQEPNPTPVLDESDDLVYTDPITFAFSFTNATYQVTLAISRVKSLDVTITSGTLLAFSQNELIGKTIVLEIQCDTTLCDVAACVEDEFTLLETAACGGGGWGNLTSRQKARFDYVVAMDTVRQLYAAPGCQNVNKAAEYADKIKDFLNCGCGCDDTDQPTPYTAPGA